MQGEQSILATNERLVMPSPQNGLYSLAESTLSVVKKKRNTVTNMKEPNDRLHEKQKLEECMAENRHHSRYGKDRRC